MKILAFEPGLSNFFDFSQFATNASENNKSTSGVYICHVFTYTLYSACAFI